jgi:hypothetical protein
MGGCKWCASSKRCVSPYSWECALPSNCVPNDDCKRIEPEFVGFQNQIPYWIIWAMIIVYVLIVIFSTVSLYVLHGLYVVHTTEAESSAPLTGLGVSEVGSRGSRSLAYRIIATTWSLGVIAIGIIFAIIGIYWPSAPELSMCNAEVMWKDTINMIINSVTSGKATVESEILLSVYNPNRMGGDIKSVTGDVYYKSSPVGSISMGELPIVPGSISDSLGVVSFNGFDKIAEIYYDFNVNHALVFEFDLYVNVNVAGYSVSTGIPKFQMNINEPPPQKYCNCGYKLEKSKNADVEII